MKQFGVLTDIARTQYIFSNSVNDFIQTQQEHNENSWEVVESLIEKIKTDDDSIKQNLDELSDKIIKVKENQPKFSMKWKSVEFGVPPFFKTKFERTKED